MQKNAANMTVTEFEEWLKMSKSRIYHWINETHSRSGLINSINSKKSSAYRSGAAKPTNFVNQTRRAMNRGASKWKP